MILESFVVYVMKALVLRVVLKFVILTLFFFFSFDVIVSCTHYQYE